MERRLAAILAADVVGYSRLAPWPNSRSPTSPSRRSRSAPRHCYTCREADADGGCYLYEGPFRAFRAELPVDADGLVLDYPEIFRRIA